MRCCPECGRPVSSLDLGSINAIDAIAMPRRERLVVDAVVSSFPRIVSMSSLEQWVYDDVGDEMPDNGSLLAHISKARKKLIAAGFTIRNFRFQGYRLEQLAYHGQQKYEAAR